MFPTKTSRDVEMVHCISETTGSCMEKSTGTKSSGTRRGIRDIVATRCTIPTSLLVFVGNIFTPLVSVLFMECKLHDMQTQAPRTKYNIATNTCPNMAVSRASLV